jgi:uracil phosphoribosyltransferase
MVVHVCSHPLLRHKMTFLRDKSVQPKEFRELSREIASLMAYEAMKELPTMSRPVSTPSKETVGDEISEKIAFVPVMRSGLGMVDGFIYAFPNAQVWHVGMYRDPKTLVPIEYYNRFTNEPTCTIAYVLDPTLSCGAVARAAVSTVKAWGVKNIKLVTFVASPEGIKSFTEEHPDVDVFAASIDEGLGT